MLGTVTIFLPAYAFKRSARATLAHHFPPERSDSLWNGARNRQAELKKVRPRHTLGVNLLIRYMEWDAALYQAALAEGLPKEQAGKLIEETNWRTFEPMTAFSFKLSRLRSSHRLTRTQWLMDLMFRVMFTAPFKRNKLADRDQVAFDVTQCPLAQYFRELGMPELTKYAACSLDHYMAAQWGMKLQRTTTIAEGAPLCDFRFQIKEIK